VAVNPPQPPKHLWSGDWREEESRPAPPSPAAEPSPPPAGPAVASGGPPELPGLMAASVWIASEI